MKRLLRRAAAIFAGAVCLLVVVLAYRTNRYARRISNAPAAVVQAGSISAAVDSTAIGRLSEAIRIPTVTQFESTPNLAEFRKLHAFLRKSYPLVHSRLAQEILDSATLLFTWRGTDSTLAPVLLMGHQDVVPVEPGTEKEWKHGAFSGDVADGYVWGRGTLDDKISVLGLLEGAEALLKGGYQPRRTLIFAFGYTEEGLGATAAHTAQILKSRGVRPWFVMDEGGALGDGLVPGTTARIALIGVSEKGYVNLKLTAHGDAGHSSMPPSETAVSILGDAVGRVQRHPLPSRLNDATLAMFNHVGPLMSYPRRVVMANLWLFEPLLVSQLEGMPAGNALVRTTTAATMISGGVKDNVIPSTASAVINFRLMPGDSIRWLVQQVKQTVADPRVDVEVMSGASREAADVSPDSVEAFGIIARSIREIWPDTHVAPYLLMGGTDAANFYVVSPNVYRFAPILANNETLKLPHGINERVAVGNYLDGVRFYTRLIENASR